MQSDVKEDKKVETESIQSLLSVDYENRTQLYRMLGAREFETALSRIETHPIEVKTFIKTQYEESNMINTLSTDNTLWYNRLPLHLSCERRPNLNLIQALVAAYPESLTISDEHERIPLILACKSKASAEVISFLIQENLSTVYMPDDQKKLALHWACEYSASPEVLDKLLNIDGDKGDLILNTVSFVDIYGRVALHWISLSLKPDIEVFRKLVNIFPGAVFLKDNDGNTPKDYLFDSIANSKTELIEILENVEKSQLIE